jgi:hypothetical protein
MKAWEAGKQHFTKTHAKALARSKFFYLVGFVHLVCFEPPQKLKINIA